MINLHNQFIEYHSDEYTSAMEAFAEYKYLVGMCYTLSVCLFTGALGRVDGRGLTS